MDRPDAHFVPAAALMDGETDPAAVVGEAALRRYATRLKALNQVHQTLARPISLKDLFELILDSAFDLLQPDQGALFLKQPDGTLACIAERRQPGAPAATFSSQSLATEVIDKGLAALVMDASTDERFAESPSFVEAGIRSLVAAPFLHVESRPGMIVLTSQVHRRKFSQEDRELLVSLASVAGLRIRNIALVEDAGRRLLLEQELRLARQIQLALLPEMLPPVPGYALLAESQPSRTVSGDLYLVRERTGGEVVFLVADVSGKGMAASLLTASLEALATGPIEEGLPADEICLKLSRRLYARTAPERFATAFLAVLAPASGRLRYANAGHNPPIHLRNSGEIDRLGATGPPLGILPSASYSLGEVDLRRGDALVVYTDGITEAANADDEEYGLARLEEVCQRSGDAPLEALHAALDADLQRFVAGVPFADDRTLVLVRRFAGEDRRLASPCL